MKPFRWNTEKNEWLKQQRDVSFEEISAAIDLGGLVDIIDHPNQDKHPHQLQMHVLMNNYVYIIPFIDEGNTWFLKTIFPSRKYTKLHKKETI